MVAGGPISDIFDGIVHVLGFEGFPDEFQAANNLAKAPAVLSTVGNPKVRLARGMEFQEIG